MVKNLHWRQIAAVLVLVVGLLSIWGTNSLTLGRIVPTVFLVAAFCWVFFWPGIAASSDKQDDSRNVKQ